MRELNPEQEVNALRALQDSPGWRLIVEAMSARKQKAYQDMMASDDQFKMAKFMGAYRAFTELLEFPQTRIDSTQQQIAFAKSVDVAIKQG